MFRQKILQVLRWLWEEIDTIIALLLGAICSILGFIGIAHSFILASVTLGILTILAFALIRDRLQREHIQHNINQLMTKFDGPGFDATFNRYVDDTPILVDAEREAWFVEETGSYQLETKKASIKSLLRKGGEVRFVVINPKEEILRRLALRNADFSHQAITERSKLSQHYINSLVSDLGADAERLQFRFTPYIIDIACVFVDPSSLINKKRKASILYLGFRVPFEERLGIFVQGDTSPKLFSNYYQQVRSIFEYASKVVLITGPSQSGKTSMLMKLTRDNSIESGIYLFSVFSRAVWRGNKHIGYEVITSTEPLPRRFATRQSNGSFEVNTDVWTSVANELEQAYLKGKIIVVDEIGPLQLQNADFLRILEKIISDPSATMFATVALDVDANDFLRKIKLHYRSTVLRLSPNTKERDEIEKILMQEMKTSLHLAHFESP